MKFNAITQELFTDSGQLIKRLSCAFDIDWEALGAESGTVGSRKCSICSHSVLDTALVDGDTLLRTVIEKPATCLKVHIDQHNIKITNYGLG